MTFQVTYARSAAVAGVLVSALLPSSVGGCSSSSESPFNESPFNESPSNASAQALSQAALTGANVFRATFKTSRSTYLGAENNGGGAVLATATAAQAWESFEIVDTNGGSLASGDEVNIRAGGGQYLQAVNGGGSNLNAVALSPQAWETFRIVKANGTGDIKWGDVVGLQTVTSGSWVSAQNGGGGPVFAFGTSLGAWETLVIDMAPDPPGEDDPGAKPDFGPNVLVFDPSMSMSEIQRKMDTIYDVQAGNHWGPARYAYLFKPGRYDLDVQLGFHMQVLGLGKSPDDVRITGAVRSKAGWNENNATQNFWRAAENIAVVPTEDARVNVWAVSQGTSFRRMHVMGSMILSDGGWSSGGFIADSVFDVSVSSGSQQQFLTRNTALSKWNGDSWNMVFVGDEQAPSFDSWPSPSNTIVAETPVLREKPYLTINGRGSYEVVVPHLVTRSHGPSWRGGAPLERSLSLSAFYVARPERDTADTINAALAQGKHLMFTPGVYHLSRSITVSRPDTIAMGLGLATLVPDGAFPAMEIADVDGVTVAGLIFEAGPQESPTLLHVGSDGTKSHHAAFPTALFDISCMVGGTGPATASSCVIIDSHDVIVDNAWMWRADHGTNVGWDRNRAKNGIIVNGDDVLAYGLFVEHFQEYQTLWNGNGGRVYFYQSELPYDPPNQASWIHDGVPGYASYKVADTVTRHDAIGLGVYCVFFNPVVAANAIEAPTATGVSLHHMATLWLGRSEQSGIEHIINGTGDPVNSRRMHATTPF